MSAEANLAGLFPPQGAQIWDPDLPWQPIPIHTVPELKDPVLSMKRNCPRYTKELNKLFSTEYFTNISRNNHDLYVYLTKYSGTVISSLESMEYLYNTLNIERNFNFTLPDWTVGVFPNKMRSLAALSFATMTYTERLARLKVGLFFNEILGKFSNVTSGKTQNFFVYSAHDTNIASLLNAMGAFEYHSPPFASTILFELHRINDKFHLNLFYKNTSEPQKILLKGCEFDCDLDEFREILKPLVINLKEWERECELGWLDFFHLNDFFVILILGFLFGLVMLIMGIFFIARCYKNFTKEGATIYMQLPNDEMA